MDDKGRPDRRGTIWDWPVPAMLICAVLLAVTRGPVYFLLICFFAVVLMARRGVFSPRDR